MRTLLQSSLDKHLREPPKDDSYEELSKYVKKYINENWSYAFYSLSRNRLEKNETSPDESHKRAVETSRLALKEAIAGKSYFEILNFIKTKIE